jgi:hypothetical protein
MGHGLGRRDRIATARRHGAGAPGRLRLVLAARQAVRRRDAAARAADGRHVLTASKDGTARMHDCAVCASLDELRRMVPDHISAGRRLTAAERRTYLHAD